MKRARSPSFISNPFIKAQNLSWEVVPPSTPASLSAPISPPRLSKRRVREEAEPTIQPKRSSEPSSSANNDFLIPSAAVESGEVIISDPLTYFSTKLASYIRTPSPISMLSITDFVDLYKSNQKEEGRHFVIQQHDHPIAGTHYDLRLQFSKTSSISFAIMYGLPGDPNSRRLNRNATETRVHNVWNHLIETASLETGTLLIWDTGTYTLLPHKSKHAPPSDPSSPTSSPSSFTSASASPTPSIPLTTAFPARKLTLRLHGTRLPRNYTLNLRLPSPATNTTQPAPPPQKLRRRRQASRTTTLHSTPLPSSSSSPSPSSSSHSTSPPSPSLRATISAETAKQETEQVHLTNAYPGASNTIGSEHQRSWYLSLNRGLSGFIRVKSEDGSVRWERRGKEEGEGFEPFYVRGPEVERSVVTGRTAADVLEDEGVIRFVRRKGWMPVIG